MMSNERMNGLGTFYSQVAVPWGEKECTFIGLRQEE